MRNLPKRSVMVRPAPGLLEMQGPRLNLRPPRRIDSAEIFTYSSDPRATRYLGWRPHQCETHTLEFIKACEAGWRSGKRLRWVIVTGQDKVVGMIEAQLSRVMAGVGYVITPAAWGKGYATEALNMVVGGLFEFTHVPSVWAVCDLENIASVRVLEKAGFKRRNLLPAYRRCPNIGGAERDFAGYVRERTQALKSSG